MSVNPLEPAIAPGTGAAASTAQSPANQSALYKKAAGNWDTANESYFNAVKAIGEKDTALQQIAQRNEQLEAMVAQVIGHGGPPVNDDPFAAIQSELGLPMEPMRLGIRSEVKTALEELLGPVLSQYQAESTLAEEIENFDQLKGATRKYMKENPEVAETFNAVVSAKPAQAWKYAIREMLISQGGHPAGPPNIAHAGLPGGHGGSVGRTEASGNVPDETKLKEALEYANTFGDNSPYRHERLKGTSVERAVRTALQQTGFTNLPDGGLPQGW